MTNIMRQRYSDDDTEDDAFDSRGVLRDGRTTRVSMQTRDASRRKARESDMLDAVNNRPRVTTCIVDGNGNGGLALNRPGYRISTDHDTITAGKSRVADAYETYQRELCSRWQTDNNVEVDVERHNSSDGSVIHQTTDHATRMNRLYSQLDSELSQAWRGNNNG
jgi:hypothetical protein